MKILNFKLKISPSGFTLIELLWSIAIASILSSVGIAAFFTYSRQQTLNSAVSEFTTMLQIAKSRAQTQIKDCPSGNYVLERYDVVLSKTEDEYNIYKLWGICSGNTKLIQSQKLPKGIKFINITITDPKFSFGVLTGATSGLGSVVISGNGKAKTVCVSTSGVIRVIDGGICP